MFPVVDMIDCNMRQSHPGGRRLHPVETNGSDPPTPAVAHSSALHHTVGDNVVQTPAIVLELRLRVWASDKTVH